MRKVLWSSAISLLILTACAAPQGKTTVSQAVKEPEPTEFVLTADKPVDRKKETPTVKEASVEEDKESSVSPFLVAHMIKHGLPEVTAKKYARYIMEASESYKVDPFTILSVIHVETGGTFRFKNRPNSHGAIGLMQIRKKNVECNATNSCTSEIWKGYSVRDLYDPKKNIMLGTKYLRYLMNRFGNDLGIAAYNQGEGNVSRGTYRMWYFNKVHKVFKSIEGNNYRAKSSQYN
jgi:uncharacterized protein YcfL